LVTGLNLAEVRPPQVVQVLDLEIEIADTPEEHMQGLSGRKSLPENTGMLFIFDEPSRPGFWMKDMHFPIDIIWIDEDWRIVKIDENLSPENYPEILDSPILVKYVLEVNAGYARENNLEIRNKLGLNQVI